MKELCAICCAIFCVSLSLFSQSGVDCANAIPVTLDGVTRNYPTSSATGTSIVCTNYTGTGPITYFSFTTNSTAEKVLFDITAPTPDGCEVLLYTSNCSVLYSSNSMCFDDGAGLWSFSHVFSVLPNTMYKLRIMTKFAGNITINAKNYTPSNNTCAGAFAISATPLVDNNACHVAGTGVSPTDLCALTLENTAFYKYSVETDGISIININNISCDNGSSNNNNGFQIGFFTGNCLSLTPISCYSGSGNFVTASTVSLTAGTEVVVAIDGVSGSNCKYEISVINGTVLAATINEFIGWKEGKSNKLRWTTFHESEGDYYEIQRSYDRIEFTTIGRVNSIVNPNGEAEYTFDDKEPGLVSYYRLKQISKDSKSSLSKIVEIRRVASSSGIKVDLINPARNILNLKINSAINQKFSLTIFNQLGQPVMSNKIECQKGISQFSKPLSNFPDGNYYIVLNNDQNYSVTPFIKIH